MEGEDKKSAGKPALQSTVHTHAAIDSPIGPFLIPDIDQVQAFLKYTP